jgi:hypothetical protein
MRPRESKLKDVEFWAQQIWKRGSFDSGQWVLHGFALMLPAGSAASDAARFLSDLAMERDFIERRLK